MTTDSEAPAASTLSYPELVAMVAFLMALNAMAIDIILPALQQMGSSLGVVDENTRQLPLTAYIAAFGLSQLFYGTLSDRFGRRPVLLFGLVVYVVGSFGVALAGDFTVLLAMRAVQGIGAGATRVIAVSVIRDLYGGRRMASVMSLAMMVFMAVPILAPLIGQGILLVAGWRAIIVFIGCFGVTMAIWCYFRLPETLANENRRPLEFGSIRSAIWTVVSNRVAFGYALGTGLTFGLLFGFLNSAQQIYETTYGLGVYFPIAFSSAAVVLAFASFTNSRLVERFGMRRLSHGALVGIAVMAALLYAVSWIDDGHVPFALFYASIVVIFFFFAFIGTNFNALAMDPLGHVAGTASSLIGSLQTVLGGLIGAFIGQAYDGTIRPLALGFLILSLLSFCIIVLTEPARLFGRNDPRGAPRKAPHPDV